MDSFGDNLAPTTPADLTLTPAPAGMDVSWKASEDDVKVVGYRLYRDGARIIETTSTSYSDAGLEGAKKYCYRVSAVDNDGHESPKTLEKCERTLPDTEAPTTPAGLAATVVSDSRISLSWTESTDNSSLSGYRVYRDGLPVATAASNSYQDSGLSPSTNYCYRVSAVDSSGNESAQSAQACKTTASGALSGLVANAVAPGQINLSWTASADSGVSGYNVYRDGTFLATATGTGYSDPGLASGTQYCYRVHVGYSSGMESVAYSGVCARPLSWSITTVDGTAGADVGQYSSLALDGDNKVHISYYDYNNTALKYVTNAVGSWNAEIVDNDISGFNDTGEYASIKMDSANKAHISYYDTSNWAVKYASGSAGSWVTGKVAEDCPISSCIESTSIALDSAGKAHVAFYNGTSLRYTNNSAGSWSTPETIDSGGAGAYVSLTFRNSQAHFSYYDGTNQGLKYATGTSGAWTATTVDYPQVGEFTSLALDSNGAVHISYYGAASGDLLYATNAGGAWTVTTVDDGGSDNVGMDTSIAVDSGDRIHISYYDVTNEDLKYATKDSSGQWVTSTVDAVGVAGWYSSLAAGSDGRVHISYYEYVSPTEGKLKYAVARTTYW